MQKMFSEEMVQTTVYSIWLKNWCDKNVNKNITMC